MVNFPVKLRRILIVFLFLNPQILWAFAFALSPAIVEQIKLGAGLLFGMAVAKQPAPIIPPHIQEQIRKTGIRLTKKVLKGSTPFPSFTAITNNAAAATNPSIMNSVIAKQMLPQAFVSAAQNHINAPAAATAVTQALPPATTMQQAIRYMPQAIAVTPSVAQTASSSVPVTAIKKMGTIPSEYTKNTLTAAIDKKIHQAQQAEQKASFIKMPTTAQNPNTITLSTPPPPIAAASSSNVTFEVVAQRNDMAAQLERINSNEAKSWFQEGQRIAGDPRLRALYAMQKNIVSENLTTAAKLSNSIDVMLTQLMITQNKLEHCCENEHLKYATAGIVEQYSNTDGRYIGCHTSAQIKKINSYASMKVGMGEFFGNCWTSLKKAVGAHNNIVEKFENHEFNKNLVRFGKALNEGKLDVAKSLLDFLKPGHAYDGCAECLLNKNIISSYNTAYFLQYNEYTIDRRAENLSIWSSLKKTLDVKDSQYTQKLLIAKEKIAPLLSTAISLQQKAGLAQPHPALYEFASIYKNVSAGIEYIAKLSSDHPDPSIREKHALFCGVHLLPDKFYNFIHILTYKNKNFPKELSLERNTDIRTILYNLASLKGATQETTSLLDRGFAYIIKAHEVPEHRAIFKNLAQEILSSFTIENHDKDIHLWPDFSKTFTNPLAQEIKKRILPFLNSALSDKNSVPAIDSPAAKLQREHARGIIDYIRRIHNALEKNDIEAALTIEKNALPHFTRNFFEEEIKKVEQQRAITPNQVINATVLARAALEENRKAQQTHYAQEGNSGNQANVPRFCPPGGGSASIDPEDPNKNKNKKPGITETPEFQQALDRIEENKDRFSRLGLRPLSRKKLKHIFNNHTRQGEIFNQRTPGPKSSSFTEGIDFVSIIVEALEKGEKISSGTTIYDAGKIIGETCNGPTSKIAIGLNGTSDSIRTAFPIF